ncbi:MAG: hypothetical protein M1821_006930 [Bathelium mastoideum]|nr:MAG: hypothetical protein M1821_006930 [Bathelium mastoideum]
MEPKPPVRLEWLIASYDFEQVVWPALCLQAKDMSIFPSSHFDPKTELLLLAKEVDGRTHGDFKTELGIFWKHLRHDVLLGSETARTFKAKWTVQSCLEPGPSPPGMLVWFRAVLIYRYEHKGVVNERVYDKVIIHQKARLTPSYLKRNIMARPSLDSFILKRKLDVEAKAHLFPSSAKRKRQLDDENAPSVQPPPRRNAANRKKMTPQMYGQRPNYSLSSQMSKLSLASTPASASHKQGASLPSIFGGDNETMQDVWSTTDIQRLASLKKAGKTCLSDMHHYFPDKTMASLHKYHQNDSLIEVTTARNELRRGVNANFRDRVEYSVGMCAADAALRDPAKRNAELPTANTNLRRIAPHVNLCGLANAYERGLPSPNVGGLAEAAPEVYRIANILSTRSASTSSQKTLKTFRLDAAAGKPNRPDEPTVSGGTDGELKSPKKGTAEPGVDSEWEVLEEGGPGDEPEWEHLSD